MPEDTNNTEQPTANTAPDNGAPLPPPAPNAQPQQPASGQSAQPVQTPQPAQPAQPGIAPAQPAQPQAQQQPPVPPEQPQNPQGQQNQQPQQDQQPQPTFRENGAFSFFATPSDPDDDPTPMSVGFKIGWFVLGLIGGMLGLFMAWLSTSTLSQKRRRQALIWTWAGFAVQAIIFFIVVLSGGTLPGMPTGGTAAQSASSAGTGAAGTGSGSAFG